MSAATKTPPIFFRPQTVALLLGVRPQTLRRWTTSGAIPSRLDADCQVVYESGDVLDFEKPLASEVTS